MNQQDRNNISTLETGKSYFHACMRIIETNPWQQKE